MFQIRYYGWPTTFIQAGELARSFSLEGKYHTTLRRRCAGRPSVAMSALHRSVVDVVFISIEAYQQNIFAAFCAVHTSNATGGVHRHQKKNGRQRYFYNYGRFKDDTFCGCLGCYKRCCLTLPHCLRGVSEK